jgi:hypothetical protein
MQAAPGRTRPHTPALKFPAGMSLLAKASGKLPISKAFDRFRHHASQIMINEAQRKAKEADETDRKGRKPRQSLARPDGSDPDGFYRQLAEAYRDVVQTTPKVAKALADEVNVPVGTVHRWVLEARRRGFLTPARQGRAG